MATTVQFQKSDAQTIDTDYDDDNLATGAFRKNSGSTTLTMEVHPEDLKFAQFKAKYIADIEANMTIFRDMPAYMALYNGIQNMQPVKETAEKAPGTTQAAGLISYSDPVYHNFTALDASSIPQIPADWFEAYINAGTYDPDGAGEQSSINLSNTLTPEILALFYDNSKNPGFITVEYLERFIKPFEPQDNVTGLNMTNAREAWTNYFGNDSEVRLQEIAGGPEKLAHARQVLESVVIPHFKNKTRYTKFEISKKQGETVAATYSVTAFIDPKGSLEIQVETGSGENVQTVARIYSEFGKPKKTLTNLRLDDDTSSIDGDTLNVIALAFRTNLDGKAADAFDKLIGL